MRHRVVADAERAHESVAHEVGERPVGILERDLRVRPVEVVEVERVTAQAPQRPDDLLPDPLGPCVLEERVAAAGADDEADLRRDEGVRDVREALTDEFLSRKSGSLTALLDPLFGRSLTCGPSRRFRADVTLGAHA